MTMTNIFHLQMATNKIIGLLCRVIYSEDFISTLATRAATRTPTRYYGHKNKSATRLKWFTDGSKDEKSRRRISSKDQEDVTIQVVRTILCHQLYHEFIIFLPKFLPTSLAGFALSFSLSLSLSRS